MTKREKVDRTIFTPREDAKRLVRFHGSPTLAIEAHLGFPGSSLGRSFEGIAKSPQFEETTRLLGMMGAK